MYQMNYKYVNDGSRSPNFNFVSINFQNGVKPKFLQQIYGYKVIKSGKTKNDTKYISSYQIPPKSQCVKLCILKIKNVL